MRHHPGSVHGHFGTSARADLPEPPQQALGKYRMRMFSPCNLRMASSKVSTYLAGRHNHHKQVCTCAEIFQLIPITRPSNIFHPLKALRYNTKNIIIKRIHLCVELYAGHAIRQIIQCGAGVLADNFLVF